MRLIHAPAEIEISGAGGLFLTVGNFDGFHLGHQAVIAELTTTAEPRGGVSVAVTFDPHPVTVVDPERSPALLTPGDEKAALI